ncbi:MAG TPA: hypothetical protein DDZ89_19900, partial [Clostridiales bacterium]|nr:hypothetical protein [Clostridiales bacterium]
HTLGLDSNYYTEKAVTLHNGVMNCIDDLGIPDIISNDMLSAFQIRLSTQYTPNTQNGEVRVVLRMEPWESTIGKNVELNWIRIDDIWTYVTKDNSIFLDSKAITGSSAMSFYGEAKKNLSHTLQYIILPRDTQQSVVAGITINYTMNGVTFFDTLYEEVNVNRLILNVPEQVLQGDAAKSVTITGQAPEGIIVDIYDDDIKIATVESDYCNSFSVIASLTQPDKPGVRFITGKMTYKENEYITPEKAIEVLSRTASAYTSKVKFIHQLSSTLSTEFYFDDIVEGQYASYNPRHMTTISFRINNMLKSQVDSAAVVISYKGTENAFPAEWVRDVQGEETYSEWSVTDTFGYIDDLYIQYSLKSLDDLSLFTGSTVPDFLEASSAQGDPAQIPS